MELSDYILGLWRMDSWGNTPQENCTLIHSCLDAGINTFDQANIYGWQPSCEELLGEALSIDLSLREKMKIISKCNIYAHDLPAGHVKHYQTSYESILSSVDLSLERMHIQHLDVLLIHRLDYLMDADEVAKAFTTLKDQGKVLEFGVSNFSTSAYTLLQSRLPFPLITHQVELNPLRFDSIEDGTLDLCQEKRIRPMAWSPLAGGELFSSTPSEACQRVITCLSDLADELSDQLLQPHANELPFTSDQVALAWVKRHPSRPRIILGSHKMERIKRALLSDRITLTPEQWYRVWTASKGYEVP